jgi:hypothetical protein
VLSFGFVVRTGGQKCPQKTKIKKQISCSVLDTDPDLIRIQSGQWIQNPDQNTGGKNENKKKKKVL